MLQLTRMCGVARESQTEETIRLRLADRDEKVEITGAVEAESENIEKQDAEQRETSQDID